jgi:hypothetical protein
MKPILITLVGFFLWGTNSQELSSSVGKLTQVSTAQIQFAELPKDFIAGTPVMFEGKIVGSVVEQKFEGNSLLVSLNKTEQIEPESMVAIAASYAVKKDSPPQRVIDLISTPFSGNDCCSIQGYETFLAWWKTRPTT